MSEVIAIGPEGRPLGRDVVEGVARSYEDARDRGGESIVDLRMAATVVRMRFAGTALLETLAPAFAHLVIDEPTEAPGLTVRFWDSRSTGATPPPRPPTPAEHAEGALFHFEQPPVRAAYQPGLETLSVLDGDTGEAWHWVADADAQPYWDKASPIRQILFWWLAGRGYLQVHGAAVGRADGGVLLVGRGGSGKSTTALSVLGTELLYAGDDYVAVAEKPEPRVQSLYNTGKLEPDHINALLPHLLPVLSNADRLSSEKAVMSVQRHFPAQTTDGFPLRAVVVPRVRAGQSESRVVDVSRAEAFAALAPSTIFQLHTAGGEALSMMSSLLGRVPCYGLELGSDIPGIPVAIEGLLDRLAEERA